MENYKSPEKIKKMFNEIAQKYDFMNNIISFGLHGTVKKRAIDKIRFKNNSEVLDLCCGTGDITNLLANKKEVKNVIGADFSENMLKIAEKKKQNCKIEYINADCTKLPFEDNRFDVITMFFGLRNIENTNEAIKEVYRILKPDGQFIHFDFKNENKLLDSLFNFFVPIISRLTTKTPKAYEYLIKSKKDFFRENEIIDLFKKNKFKLLSKHSFLFSTVIFYSFIKE